MMTIQHIDRSLNSKDAVIHADLLHSHGQFVVSCGQHSVAVLVKNGKVQVNQGPNNPLATLSTDDVDGPDVMADRLREAGFRPLQMFFNGTKTIYAEWLRATNRLPAKRF